MERFPITARGMTFDAIAEGPPVPLLHGFPEAPERLGALVVEHASAHL